MKIGVTTTRRGRDGRAGGTIGTRPEHISGAGQSLIGRVPYIGHAYEAIATDAIARFERLDGKDVVFADGSREQIDVIVWATGYDIAFPFFASAGPSRPGRNFAIS